MAGQRPTLDHVVGTREDGQDVRLTGSEVPIPVSDEVEWSDYESLTVSTTALQITEDLRSYNRAFITVEDQIVRYRIDGGVPTATDGIRVLVNDIIKLKGVHELERFRVIRQDGTDATLRVTVGSRV